jgi:hypothetical protein
MDLTLLSERVCRSWSSLNSLGSGCRERLLPLPVGLRLDDATAASAALVTSWEALSDSAPVIDTRF